LTGRTRLEDDRRIRSRSDSAQTKAGSTPGTEAPASQTSAPAPASAVLALQRQAGNRATAAHVRMLQRQVSSDQLLTRLEKSIPILALTLKKVLPQGVDVASHLRASLALYDQHMEGKAGRFDDAMRVAAILSAVAGSIARTANDPRMKPKIAEAMADAFEAELKAALAGSGDAAHISKHFKLGRDLAGNDTIPAYLTGKKPVMTAAFSIIDLAKRRGRSPARIFDLLVRQFEIDLAAFDLEHVQRGQLKRDDTGGGNFELSGLTGEISPAFFTSLFEGGTPTFENGRAKFKEGIQAKLKQLEQAVDAPDQAHGAVSSTAIQAQKTRRGASLSDAQAAHFERLERDEAGESDDYAGQGSSARDFIAASFKRRYGCKSTKEAKKLVTKVVAKLNQAPMTITFNPESLFGTPANSTEGPKWGPAYKSEPALLQADYELNQLLMLPGNDPRGAGKTVRGAKLPLDPVTKLPPEGDMARIRGRNYARFRIEKDERETRFHDLAAEDLPVFGALNPNWEKLRGGGPGGTDAPVPKAGVYTTPPWGSNYYGDNHLVLRESCRPRSAFIIRMFGKETVERTDMELMLADLVTLQKSVYIDGIVYDIQDIDKIVVHGLDMETHVYGGVDLRTDVKEIWLQHALFAENQSAATPAGRIKRFAAANGITVHDVGTAPADLRAYTMWQPPTPAPAPVPAVVAH
jgi:hypothetical protein